MDVGNSCGCDNKGFVYILGPCFGWSESSGLHHHHGAILQAFRFPECRHLFQLDGMTMALTGSYIHGESPTFTAINGFQMINSRNNTLELRYQGDATTPG